MEQKNLHEKYKNVANASESIQITGCGHNNNEMNETKKTTK